MSDFYHEVVFKWPRTEPSEVIVTGTFDQWSSSLRLEKGPDGFTGRTHIEYGQKIAYKFVVDGQWTTDNTLPTETDESGNINNVYFAPEKPVKATENGEAAKQNGDTAEADSKRFSTLTDLATTIVAADGTSSALEYVTSSVGGAIKGVIGVDPWSPVKIGFETQESGFHFEEQPPNTEPSEAKTETPENAPVSPIVPLPIVPVNAPENNDPVPSTKAEVTAAVQEPSTHRPIPPVPPTAQEKVLASDDTPPPAINEVELVPEATPVESAPLETKPLPEEPKSLEPQTNGMARPQVALAATGASNGVVPSQSEEQTKVPETAKDEKPTEQQKGVEPIVAEKEECQATEPTVPETGTKSQEPETENKDKTPVTETEIKAPVTETETKAEPVKQIQPVVEPISQPPKEEKTLPASVIASPSATAPSTPAKKQHAFPSTESSSSVTDSPPSAFSTRKKKGSIFRRISIKGIFGGDKDKEKK